MSRGCFDAFGNQEALPLDASLILDIGCGAAGIDILLYRHYARHNPPQIYLADLSETSPVIRYDFSSSPAIYNSLEVARSLLSMNGIPMGLIHIISPQQLALLDIAGKFNLVISTIAWGFHFPVPTYLDTVYRPLAHSGRLIMDIRSGTDGIDHLRTTFRSVDILSQNETKSRVVTIK